MKVDRFLVEDCFLNCRDAGEVVRSLFHMFSTAMSLPTLQDGESRGFLRSLTTVQVGILRLMRLKLLSVECPSLILVRVGGAMTSSFLALRHASNHRTGSSQIGRPPAAASDEATWDV